MSKCLWDFYTAFDTILLSILDTNVWSYYCSRILFKWKDRYKRYDCGKKSQSHVTLKVHLVITWKKHTSLHKNYDFSGVFLYTSKKWKQIAGVISRHSHFTSECTGQYKVLKMTVTITMKTIIKGLFPGKNKTLLLSTSNLPNRMFTTTWTVLLAKALWVGQTNPHLK